MTVTMETRNFSKLPQSVAFNRDSFKLTEE